MAEGAAEVFGRHGQTCLTVLASICFRAYVDTLKASLSVPPEMVSVRLNTYKHVRATHDNAAKNLTFLEKSA
jgi:hypothetical protein